MLTQKGLTVKLLGYWVVAQFEISESHLEGVIPKAGAFQPAEGSCVRYPGSTAREIPHFA